MRDPTLLNTSKLPVPAETVLRHVQTKPKLRLRLSLRVMVHGGAGVVIRSASCLERNLDDFSLPFWVHDYM